MSLPSEASFTKKLAIPENCNDGLLSLVGKDGDFYLPAVNIENGVRGIPLREYGLSFDIVRYGLTVGDLG